MNQKNSITQPAGAEAGAVRPVVLVGVSDEAGEGAVAALVAEVPADCAGERLDVVAARLFSSYSRARLQAWIADGRLTRNEAPAQRAREPVAAGDRLAIIDAALGDVAESEVAAQPIALAVIAADADFAVIDKPAGLVVHPGAGVRDGTLQNALLHRFPQTAQVPRAGIVHRLDKDTSGLLVVALNLAAHARLVAAMARREVKREYVALARGVIASGGTVDAPLDRHPRDRLKRAVVASGRPAVTHYRVAERFAHHTLLDVQLETGRTHQIRVHLAHLRHPIVGDPLYGGTPARGTGQGLRPELRAALGRFSRQALHARRLSFAHPRLGAALCFESPLPADFAELLARLREQDRA